MTSRPFTISSADAASLCCSFMAWAAAALPGPFKWRLSNTGFGSSFPICPAAGTARRRAANTPSPDSRSAMWRLMDHLKIRQTNIVGFSLGGAVALEMATLRPTCVPKLGLINSLATYQPRDLRKWLETYVSATLVRMLGMPRAACLMAARLFPEPWQRAMREHAARVDGIGSREFLSGNRIGVGALGNPGPIGSLGQPRLADRRRKRLHAAGGKARIGAKTQCRAGGRARLASWHALRFRRSHQCQSAGAAHRPAAASSARGGCATRRRARRRCRWPAASPKSMRSARCCSTSSVGRLLPRQTVQIEVAAA